MICHHYVLILLLIGIPYSFFTDDGSSSKLFSTVYQVRLSAVSFLLCKPKCVNQNDGIFFVQSYAYVEMLDLGNVDKFQPCTHSNRDTCPGSPIFEIRGSGGLYKLECNKYFNSKNLTMF